MSSPLHPAIDPLDIYPPGIFLLFFWPSHGACRISVSKAGIKPTSPAVEAQNLKYWTTQEAPSPRTLSCVHTKTLPCVQSSSPSSAPNWKQPRWLLLGERSSIHQWDTTQPWKTTRLLTHDSEGECQRCCRKWKKQVSIPLTQHRKTGTSNKQLGAEVSRGWQEWGLCDRGQPCILTAVLLTHVCTHRVHADVHAGDFVTVA